MSLKLLGEESIESVLVLDDDVDARASYRWLIEDLPGELDLAEEVGAPQVSAQDYAMSVLGRADAVLCDHHLRKRNYASFNGAELVAKLYNKVPAVLCTKWEQVDLVALRSFRKWVPVVTREVDEASLVKGWEACLKEFRDGPPPSRRPWRTPVHVQGVSDQVAYVSLPGWISLEIIQVSLTSIPGQVRAALREDFSVYAAVNIGAELQADLYFDDWELP